MEELLKRYMSDVGPAEFPVTAMSGALARSIDHLLDSLATPMSTAIDVGTGNGIHAAVMALHRVPSVLAIDVNAESVREARLRLERMRSHIGADSAVDFLEMDVDGVADLGRQFDLVVTNPPSFFRPAVIKGTDRNSVESGVYDSPRSDKSNPASAFLFRFWRMVGQVLSPGGVAVCTWPGLERRLVHASSDPDDGIVHPTSLLARWFNWEIDGAPTADDWRDFYRTPTIISDYGLGESFTEQLNYDVNVGGLYSALVLAPNGRVPALSFSFGVLALQRDKKILTKFRVLPANPYADSKGRS